MLSIVIQASWAFMAHFLPAAPVRTWPAPSWAPFMGKHDCNDLVGRNIQSTILKRLGYK